MLDFDPNRTPVTPRPAATIILLREVRDEVEICVMQRSNKSSFMGGAVVFPGGRVEPHDSAAHWGELAAVDPPSSDAGQSGEWWDDDGVAARIAACREALEEVGVAPVRGMTGTPVDATTLHALRAAATVGVDELRAAMRQYGVALDLASMVPLARWVTPVAEQRRFDARFFLAAAPANVEGSGDEREATRMYWATATHLLEEFARRAITLFPPTHRTLELLAGKRTVEGALAIAREVGRGVICPRFVMDGETAILALPGDPHHDVAERRMPGGTRYVLRDGLWTSEEAPPTPVKI